MQGSPFIPQHHRGPTPTDARPMPAQTLPVPQAPISNQNRYLPVSNVEQGQRIQYNPPAQQWENGQLRRIPPQTPGTYTTPVSR